MAWIESHQSLGNHPKTIRLARELKVGVPTAIGYLHLLWWWALDYAPVGTLSPLRRDAATQACRWSKDPDRFWRALGSAGFVDELPDGTLAIHDWAEYAGRLVQRREIDAERKRVRRTELRTSGEVSVDVRRTVPTGPTNLPDLPARAREPGPGGPLAAALTDPEPLPNGAKQCPLCPEVFTTSYDEHLSTSPRHKIRDQPEDFKGKRPKSAPYETPTVSESLEAEHARLVAKDRANGK